MCQFANITDWLRYMRVVITGTLFNSQIIKTQLKEYEKRNQV